MRTLTRAALIATLASPLGGLSATAQDTPTAPSAQTSPELESDWEIARDPKTKTTLALVTTTTGLAIAVRCMNGSLDAVIGGLPELNRSQRTRTLNITFRDEHEKDSRWNVTTSRTTAIADYPAAFARNIREGGRVQIGIPDGAGPGRTLKHDLTLPGSTTAIDEILTACEKPLVDPRDQVLPEIEEGGLPRGVVWERVPRPSYPSTNYARGYAVITCVVNPDGGLDDCRIESEQPADGRFGRAAQIGVQAGRVRSPGEVLGQYAPRTVGVRVNFQMPQ